jgi:PKD repeat protein
MHLGMDIATTINGGAGNTLRNLCTIMAGASPATPPFQIQATASLKEGAPSPSPGGGRPTEWLLQALSSGDPTTVTNAVSYTFAQPNDNWLVALWTDGIAAEYEPGITTAVTLTGFADHTVTGIDVLYGFEQPVITSEEEGDLIIRDLLVKDYPILLRVSPIVSPASLAISGPTAGRVDTTHSFTATVDPITVTVPITYTWQATGQSAVTNTESLTVTDRVSFTWATGGSKTITVTARNEDGPATSTHLVTIYEPPVADFAAVPTSGIAPLTVAFTNTSQGEFGTSLWDFGDGVTSTRHSPSHTYTVPGAYTVTLTVSGPGGAGSMTRSNFVTVYEPVNASFTASPTSGTPPLTVAFTNTSTGDYADSLWQFGDGVTSTLESPTHTYATVGTYTVTLTVAGPGGTGVEMKDGYITVKLFNAYLPLVTRDREATSLQRVIWGRSTPK